MFVQWSGCVVALYSLMKASFSSSQSDLPPQYDVRLRLFKLVFYQTTHITING